MRHIKNKFMDVSIKKKMICSYIIVALIPFLIVGIIGISVFMRQSRESVSNHTIQMMEQVKTSIDMYVNSFESMANYLLEEVKDIKFEKMDSENDIIWRAQKSELRNKMKKIASTHTEIAGILIATQNDMYISTGMNRVSRDSFLEESWYKVAVNNPEEFHLLSALTGRNITSNKEYSFDDVISLVKAIVNPVTKEVVGVLLIDIKHDIISNAIKKVTIGENGFVFVLNKESEVVYAPNNSVIYRVNPMWLSDEGKAVETSIQNENYQIRFVQSDYTKWKIVGVFSIDEIMSSINKMLFILSGCLCITIFLVILVSIKVSQTITEPIVRLKQLMKRAEDGELDVRYEGVHGDEISELGYNFNHMLEKIQNLVNLVYQEQKNKRMAELKVIQEQIKPHFLYNTLDTINWMARKCHAGEIVKLVDALTNMFRIGLSKGKDYISIEEEMKYINNYLYIQNIRYGTKLNYEIKVEESLKRQVVPKLILQPLVENAIYHGIKLKRGDGHIIIEVAEGESGMMELSVMDDGPGMQEEMVQKLRIRLNHTEELDEQESFGLFYVRERLHIRYGTRFSVKVQSVLNEGTMIKLCIAKDDENEQNQKDT